MRDLTQGMRPLSARLAQLAEFGGKFAFEFFGHGERVFQDAESTVTYRID
jgi:hypothetical protein